MPVYQRIPCMVLLFDVCIINHKAFSFNYFLRAYTLDIKRDELCQDTEVLIIQKMKRRMN